MCKYLRTILYICSMNTSIAISLDTRRPKKDGTFPLILRISHKLTTTSIKLGEAVHLNDWDDDKKRVKGSYKATDSLTRLNNAIQKKKVDALSVVTKLDEEGLLDSMTVTEIKEKILNKHKTYSFLNYTLDQISDLEKSERFGSARAYDSMHQVIEKFISKKDLTFDQITVKFLKSLEVDYLSRGNSLNGLAAILRSFRAVYNKGIDDGLGKKGQSPFETYKIRKTPTVKRAISQESINNILALKLKQTDPSFHARNYFLFSYLAFGMNFTDMALLSIKDIVDGRIHYIRQKTKQPFDLKIMDAMKLILDYYTKGKTPDDFIFPIITRSTPEGQYKDIMWARKRYNKKLKLIAEQCGIEENLTSYVSRHTAATTALFLNIPLPAISKMMGHKSITTTQTYLKSLPSSTIDSYHELLEKAMG
jgi:integrase/recombinase XerD